jgi:hypothetical protein
MKTLNIFYAVVRSPTLLVYFVFNLGRTFVINLIIVLSCLFRAL